MRSHATWFRERASKDRPHFSLEQKERKMDKGLFSVGSVALLCGVLTIYGALTTPGDQPAMAFLGGVLLGQGLFFLWMALFGES